MKPFLEIFLEESEQEPRNVDYDWESGVLYGVIISLIGLFFLSWIGAIIGFIIGFLLGFKVIKLEESK